MKSDQPKDELRMPAAEFDRMMRSAIQVHPEPAPTKPRRPAKKSRRRSAS